jgi:putative DNA primase/helicase
VTVENLLEVAKMNHWSLCQRHGFYYVFNGEFWNVVSEADLKTFLGKVAEKMGVPRFDSRHYEFKDKLFKQLRPHLICRNPLTRRHRSHQSRKRNV